MNICKFIIEHNIHHIKLEDGRIQQNGTLYLTNNKIENSSITFTNPKTNRVVFKMNEDWFGCGCFIGNKQQLKETCLEQNFLEIIEYFNL